LAGAPCSKDPQVEGGRVQVQAVGMRLGRRWRCHRVGPQCVCGDVGPHTGHLGVWLVAEVVSCDALIYTQLVERTCPSVNTLTYLTRTPTPSYRTTPSTAPPAPTVFVRPAHARAPTRSHCRQALSPVWTRDCGAPKASPTNADLLFQPAPMIVLLQADEH